MKDSQREKHIRLGQYLKDIIFAANDGIVTTFAVVAGVVGAKLSPVVVLVIGFASLIADGFSMATGNYLGTKSERELYEREEDLEKLEIKKIPEIEKSEIHKVLVEKGYQGKELDTLVALISSKEKFWLDFMMHEELRLFAPSSEFPFKHGLATFLFFIIAGSLPLLPYLLFSKSSFLLAGIFSGVSLFIVGAARRFFSNKSWIISGLEMLLVGGSAAAIAYAVGFLLRSFVV